MSMNLCWKRNNQPASNRKVLKNKIEKFSKNLFGQNSERNGVEQSEREI